MTKADAPATPARTGRHSIPTSHWRATDQSGCVVVGVHAFGDYRAAFAELADHLNPHGHDVIAFDQRGFGQTAPRGAYAGHDAYLDDLRTIVDRARTIAGDRPVVIVAESFGASVALVAIGRGLVRCDGLILSGPGVREDLPAKSIWDALIDSAASVFGSGSVALNQVSDTMSDTAQSRFRDDPLVLRDVRADTYAQVVEMADMASLDASTVKVPVLVLYSEADGIIAQPVNRRADAPSAFERDVENLCGSATSRLAGARPRGHRGRRAALFVDAQARIERAYDRPFRRSMAT